MTDPENGSELVTINTSAGEKHLQKLSPADWVKLGNIMRAGRKSEKRAELTGASEEVVKKELDEIDKRPVRYRDAEQYVNGMEGQYAAILLSLQKDDPKAGEAEFNAMELQPDAWLGITADLLNLKVVIPKNGEGGGTPNPPPTETGTPLPTKSDEVTDSPTTP